jgi:hypothetical protein
LSAAASADLVNVPLCDPDVADLFHADLLKALDTFEQAFSEEEKLRSDVATAFMREGETELAAASIEASSREMYRHIRQLKTDLEEAVRQLGGAHEQFSCFDDSDQQTHPKELY